MNQGLSPTAVRILRFSIDRSGNDGLRYEDYLEGLITIFAGVTVSQLSSALRELEGRRFIKSDPEGTPNRRIRVTPLGREAADHICNRCGRVATFIAQYGRYYCYRCAKYIDPITQPPAPAPTAAVPANTSPAPVVPPQQPAARTCPVCRRPLAYLSKYGRYYCYTCSEYR
jgi:ribosomal protein L37AE/L43A